MMFVRSNTTRVMFVRSNVTRVMSVRSNITRVMLVRSIYLLSRPSVHVDEQLSRLCCKHLSTHVSVYNTDTGSDAFQIRSCRLN